MTAGRVGRVTTARFQRVMHANHRAGCQFGIEYGAVPSCRRPTARWGFELVVALSVIEVSVFRSARDSVVDTASGFSGVISLGCPSGFVCVTDFPSRA